jgi:hypothetical protein
MSRLSNTISSLKELFLGPPIPYRHDMDNIVGDIGDYEPDDTCPLEFTDEGFEPDFEYKGEIFDHTLPHARDLDNGKLRDRVFDYMSDGKWHTLADLSFACNGSEASCSARVRDFRKAQYGEHFVDRKHVGNRLYMYRLVERYPGE